jgi:heme exporter protein D
MSAISEFFQMGGYAAFVWPAFGVTAAVMVGLAITSQRRLRANETALAALQAERRAGAASATEVESDA